MKILFPYVCHYDENTILIKNGELLQIIRITGFSSTMVISELVSLREAVRQALMENVKDSNIALGCSLFVVKRYYAAR